MTADQQDSTPGLPILGDVQVEARLVELVSADPQVAAAQPSMEIIAAISRPGLALSAIVAEVMQGYADRPALGHRPSELVTDPVTGRTTRRRLPGYDTVSYGELWSRAGALAADWHHHPDVPVRSGDFVAILGFVSVDHITVELTCIRAGAVSVPLQAGASATHLTPMLAETGARVLATSVDLLDTVVSIGEADGETEVRHVVVFDYDARIDEQRERFEAARSRLAAAARPVAVTSLTDAIEHGRTRPAVDLYTPEPGEDPLGLIIYTSGSTGTPKGAMYPHRLLRSSWAGGGLTTGRPHIGFGYLPMSHIAGRTRVFQALAAGGICYLTDQSDLSTFFEDIALARPTELMFMPRICDMIFQYHQAAIERRPVADEAERAAVEEEVRAEVRDRLLGGRLVFASVGAAPLSAEMVTFMESCLGTRLHDGYGSTETGLVTIDGRVARPPVLDYKLIDVPELGYFRTDQPHPRGELLVTSQSIFPGYFKRPEVTAEVFDAEGYYRTGDIMAEVGPDQLVYLDRRNNVLKLSQGEFVAVARLETIYTTSPMVHQIFLYGSSERAYLLAVVVPTVDALAETDHPDQLAARIAESLRQIGREQDLNAMAGKRTHPRRPSNGTESCSTRRHRHGHRRCRSPPGFRLGSSLAT